MKKHLLLLSLISAMLLSMTACTTSAESEAETEPATEAPTTAEEVTEAPTEEETVPPTNAPFPEADPNAISFDDGNLDFASIVCDDEGSADGTLSIETIDGNAMLKYTDTKTTADNLGTLVQKVSIDVTKLLTPEQYGEVTSIGFDIGAKAEGDLLVSEDGENLTVPGWIGGGGGTVTMDDKWYGFTDFSAAEINEYNLERSDLYHVEFKFLLASGGKKWDAAQEGVNFLIMRWGIQNLSSLYIDNITFYDADGNSIPLSAYGTAEPEESAAEGEAEAEEEAETAEGAAEEAETAAEEAETAESAAEESAQSEEESAE